MVLSDIESSMMSVFAQMQKPISIANASRLSGVTLKSASKACQKLKDNSFLVVVESSDNRCVNLKITQKGIDLYTAFFARKQLRIMIEDLADERLIACYRLATCSDKRFEAMIHALKIPDKRLKYVKELREDFWGRIQ